MNRNNRALQTKSSSNPFPFNVSLSIKFMLHVKRILLTYNCICIYFSCTCIIIPKVVTIPGAQSSIPGAIKRSGKFQRIVKPSIKAHQPSANYAPFIFK